MRDRVRWIEQSLLAKRTNRADGELDPRKGRRSRDLVNNPESALLFWKQSRCRLMALK
jgi:hypothetical protein